MTNLYPKENPFEVRNGFPNPTFFIDDGVSGVTFDRSGWNEMIGLSEAGKVKTVIVKHMSRMGRDYLKVGCYTESFFAERDIRYTAINDGVDSDKGDNDLLWLNGITVCRTPKPDGPRQSRGGG